MKEIYFDIMVNGRFVAQHRHRYCPLFPIDTEKVISEIIERRPTLKGKKIEIYETKNIVFKS